jgi:hypothetical protein
MGSIVTRFDDRDPGIQYSGIWGNSGTELDYLNTTTFTVFAGSAVLFNFTGTYAFSLPLFLSSRLFVYSLTHKYLGAMYRYRRKRLWHNRTHRFRVRARIELHH